MFCPAFCLVFYKKTATQKPRHSVLLYLNPLNRGFALAKTGGGDEFLSSTHNNKNQK